MLVEEQSAGAALRQIIPKIVNDKVDVTLIEFNGKQHLLRDLPKKFQGYRAWSQKDDAVRFLVLVDADEQDCKLLKAQLEDLASKAKLKTKTASPKNFVLVNRIAIEELEAWFFGDPEALRSAYPRLPFFEAAAKFRDPDKIQGGTWEALYRLMKKAGYDWPVFPKIEFARTVATHMVPGRNKSRSFQTFVAGIRSLIPPEAVKA